MKIVRNPVQNESNKLLITIIILGAVMLITSIVDVFFNFAYVGFGIRSVGGSNPILSTVLPTALAIISITWITCAALLIKTKRIFFAKIPAYVFCGLIAVSFILYYIASGNDNLVTTVLIFSLVILAMYPFIIATLTIEGRLYNRVFATIFTSILIAISFIGAIVMFVWTYEISLTLLYPTLLYTNLLLIVFVFDLKRISRASQNEKKEITH